MARKRKRAEPLTVEQAQVIAAEIARDADLLECDQCVIAIAKRIWEELPRDF